MKLSKKILIGVVVVTAGAFTWHFNKKSSASGEKDAGKTQNSPHADHDHENQSKASDQKLDLEEVYTCPMHPQIRQPSPGRCPICGMELVLADSSANNTGADDQTIAVNPVARRVAGIKTTMIETKVLKKKVRAIGSISFDESKLATIAAYVDARIEKLYADYTGVRVKKGDHLAVIYSPDLYAAQVEFLQSKTTLESMKNSTLKTVLDSQKSLFENSRTKLTELGMSKSQIRKLERSGKAKSRLEINTPIAGTVIEKPSSQGQYLKAGQIIFKVADLSTVWLLIEVFPEDARFIHYGQKVEATLRSFPDKKFSGRVAFIDPVVDGTTRTVKVRVEIPNANAQLRPGDYADAEIVVPIGDGRSAGTIYDPNLAGKYISPMHPQHISDTPAKCPICGMDMVPAEKYGFSKTKIEQEELLVIPRDAVLKVGKNSVVFVEEEEGSFKLRKVTLGANVGGEVVVVEGLEEFETIATEGVYLLDSQMQLSGKTSLIDIAPDGSVKDEKNKTDGAHNHQH